MKKAQELYVSGLSEALSRIETHMRLANYAEGTIQTYLVSVRRLGLKVGKNPLEITAEELQGFLLYLKDKMGPDGWHTYICGIKYAYVQVLSLPELVADLPKAKRVQKLPVVLNQEELAALFDACKSLKHRCLFKLAYGTGMRVGELRRLKVSDIDSKRMQIRIEQGKGRKDRYVVLPASLLEELRMYYKANRPKQYLFHGRTKGIPIAKVSIQKALQTVLKRTTVMKAVKMHSLRHTFACHAIEMGMDILTLQHLLGHAYLRSTFVYLRVAKAPRTNQFSPLDRWTD